MHTNIMIGDIQTNEMMQEEMISGEVIDLAFNTLDKKLLDRNEISIDCGKTKFISVHFLERLTQFVTRAKDLSVKIKIVNLSPVIYKVFHVARVKNILEVCE